MLKSYVGIVSHRGLDAFFPENDHVLSFLIRRAYRSGQSDAVCFWAVMQEAIGFSIQHLLENGRPDDALLTLQYLATEIGTVCPQETEEPVFSVS